MARAYRARAAIETPEGGDADHAAHAKSASPARGGQGLILGMHILFRAFGLEGRRASQSQSYEPTSRGGFCYSDVIVTDDSAPIIRW
jgi:hypothetical protein